MSSRNCNCNGGGCGGCGRGNGVLATMQTGDTFPVYLLYKEDDIEAQIGEGQDIIMAFYDYKGNRLLVCSTSDGTITLDDAGYYKAKITHEQSMMMVGKVHIELTIIDKNVNPMDVDHGDHVPTTAFSPRMNNEIV